MPPQGLAHVKKTVKFYIRKKTDTNQMVGSPSGVNNMSFEFFSTAATDRVYKDKEMTDQKFPLIQKPPQNAGEEEILRYLAEISFVASLTLKMTPAKSRNIS